MLISIEGGADVAFTTDTFQMGSGTTVVKLNEGTAAFKVYGTFTPMSDIFYGCQMQNGSTVDLSARTTVWNTTTATAYMR